MTITKNKEFSNLYDIKGLTYGKVVALIHTLERDEANETITELGKELLASLRIEMKDEK